MQLSGARFQYNLIYFPYFKPHHQIVLTDYWLFFSFSYLFLQLLLILCLLSFPATVLLGRLLKKNLMESCFFSITVFLPLSTSTSVPPLTVAHHLVKFVRSISVRSIERCIIRSLHVFSLYFGARNSLCVMSFATLWHYVSNAKQCSVICVITGTLSCIHVKTEIKPHVVISCN